MASSSESPTERPSGNAAGLQVIGLGLGRTGTGSLKVALEQLGYKTFHMSELPKDLDRFEKAWTGIYKKADAGTLTRADWDDLYGPYTATLDFPGAMFPNELYAADPDAKFILTVRDAQKWHESTARTIYRVSTFPVLQLSKLLRPQQRKIKAISERIWNVFFRGRFVQDGVATFEAHNARVQALIPRAQLLIFRVSDGWGPLCAFLGVPAPDTLFPFENEGAQMAAAFDAWARTLYREFALYYLAPALGVLGAGVALAPNRRRLAPLLHAAWRV